MDDDSPVYRKKKPSNTSKSEKRSDHKHEYEPCIVKYIFFNWGQQCRVCGRIKTDWQKSDRELIKPEYQNARSFALDHYLDIKDMKKKFPGIKVIEEYWEDHDIQTRELFE